VWFASNGFTFKGSHVGSEDVFGCDNVSPGDWTVWKLIGGHDLHELFGAWSSDDDLKLTSTNSIKVVGICIVTFILGYRIDQNRAFVVGIKVI
jgi:hypothetical protein